MLIRVSMTRQFKADKEVDHDVRQYGGHYLHIALRIGETSSSFTCMKGEVLVGGLILGEKRKCLFPRLGRWVRGASLLQMILRTGRVAFPIPVMGNALAARFHG